jgi:predicted GNAT family acetyltransferase
VSPPDIRVIDVPEASRYEALDGGELVGVLEYRRLARRITLVHTEVRPDQEGRGIGARLARVALDEARATGRQVRPLCPFVRSYLERHPEYADLIVAG